MRIGSNIKNVKLQNRISVLQKLALDGPFSRAELARNLGLSKMTISNLVNELIEQQLVEERHIDSQKESAISNTSGRPSIMLYISNYAPCICGMIIKRGRCQIVIGNLCGEILDRVTHSSSQHMTEEDLLHVLLDGFKTLKNRVNRNIIAVGISSVGPVDVTRGTILNPPDFYSIENFPIVKKLENITHLPTFLINDANAGALAEKMYGLAKDRKSFVYLHIMNGIGLGQILEGKLYNGNFGQSGEIGHTSINFAGPRCSCGNKGCLDLYANINNMQKHIIELKPLFPHSTLYTSQNPTWLEIIEAANNNDELAILVLERFCNYIACALINALNILDVSYLVVGYDSKSSGTILEQLLYQKISSSVLYSHYHQIEIIRSVFSGDAPLLGSIAYVASQIFNLTLSI